MERFNFNNRRDITTQVEQDTPIEIGTSKKSIVTIGGEKYVFKYNYNAIDRPAIKEYLEKNFKENITELNGDIIEVFSYFLLQKLGCDFCLPYDFAKYNGRNGCISPYFVKPNETTIDLKKIMFLNFQNSKQDFIHPLEKDINKDEMQTYIDQYYRNQPKGQHEFSVESIVNEVSKFCNAYKLNADLCKLKDKIQKMVIYDFFMINIDRNWQNIVFIKNNNNLCLSPLFDNGECFTMENLDRLEENYDFSKMQVEIGISERGRLVDFSENDYLNNQKIIAIDIENLTKENDEIKKLVQTFTNLDIRGTLKEFENYYKLTLLERHKNLIEIVFNMRKKFYVDSNTEFAKSLNIINQFENCKTY